MRIITHQLPLLVAPFLVSCVFLLDYDDLQGGPPAASGGTRTDGGAASGGEAGSGAPSCGDCNDRDPCTVDTCDETGDVPICAHEASEGLQLDGVDVTSSAARHVRVSVVAGGQKFFFSVLQEDKAGPKVNLYRLATDGAELEVLAPDLGLEGVPVSNVGLAVEELALGEVALHGFVATKLKAASAAARVFHVVNRNDKTMSNIAGLSYATGIETNFPQARLIGDKVVASWIQIDGTIAIHNVGTAKTDTFGLATQPATSLSLFSTSDDQPAVMFTAQMLPKQAIATYVETSAQNRMKLVECETRPGDYRSSSVIGTQIPGLWLAYMTRLGDDYLTTGSGTIVCGANSCTAVSEDCQKATPSNGLRDVAGATVRFDDDPPGIVYSVVALPQVALKAGDAAAIEGRLSLVLGRADFSTQGKVTSTTIGGDRDNGGVLPIAHHDTSQALGFAGPDWPAVAILPNKQVAVAWIQPNQTDDGSELRVQRYKMCLPER